MVATIFDDEKSFPKNFVDVVNENEDGGGDLTWPVDTVRIVTRRRKRRKHFMTETEAMNLK